MRNHLDSNKQELNPLNTLKLSLATVFRRQRLSYVKAASNTRNCKYNVAFVNTIPKKIRLAAVSHRSVDKPSLKRQNSNVKQNEISEYQAMMLYNKALFSRKKKIIDRFISYATETLTASKKDRSPVKLKKIISIAKAEHITKQTTNYSFSDTRNNNSLQPKDQEDDLKFLSTQTVESDKPMQSFLALQSLLQNNEIMRIARHRRLTIESFKPITSYRKMSILTAEKDEKDIIQKFYLAIKQNSIKTLSHMLEKFPYLVNQKLTVNEMGLHVACRMGNKEIVEILLKAGGRLDSLDYLGRTPQEVAIKWNHMHIVKLTDKWKSTSYTR